MKRLISILFLTFLLFSLVSCSQRQTQPKEGEQKEQEEKKQGEEEKEDDKEEKPDKKEGEKLVENYARALVLRDNRIKNYYSESMKQNTADYTPAQDPHPNGYMMDKIEEKEGKLEGKVKIFTVFTGEPYFSSDENNITIIKEKGSYVIDKIEKSKTTEIVEYDKVLFMKEDGDVKGKEVVRLDDLPRFAMPQGASPDQKFRVGRERFGPVALAPEDKKLAVTTIGENPSLMVVDAEKKQVKPLDLFFEGNAQSIMWSQDGKFIVVEMANKTGAKYLYIYDVEKEKRIDDPMKNVMKPDKYSINNSYWTSDNQLIFNVAGVSNLTADEQKKTGAYKLDVKNVSLSKF